MKGLEEAFADYYGADMPITPTFSGTTPEMMQRGPHMAAYAIVRPAPGSIPTPGRSTASMMAPSSRRIADMRHGIRTFEMVETSLFRARVADLIEAMVDLLDSLEPDPDDEPSLGGITRDNGGTYCGASCDLEDEAR